MVREIFPKSVSKLKNTGLSPKYMWDASTEKIKFWMLNAIYPKNSGRRSLLSEIKLANFEQRYIIHLGCGVYGEALRDLKRMGAKNLIGVDFNVPQQQSADIEYVQLDLTTTLPIADHVINGVVFGSYLFHYFSPSEQLHLLREIDRITTKGARCFLGPFFPPHLYNTEFSKEYPSFQNPLYGFIRERFNRRSENWNLYRSRVAGLGMFSGIKTSAKSRKGLRLPLFSFYDMSLRALSAKMIGNLRIKRDYKVHVPNEFFITVEKN